ncbi:hypothetical protein REPUB_Repub06bG0160600 [Reevesia pubescens]
MTSQDSFHEILSLINFADDGDSWTRLMDMNQDKIPDAMNEPSLMPNNVTDLNGLSRDLLKHARSEEQLQDDMIEPLLSPNNKEKLSPMRSGSSTRSTTKRKGEVKGKISTKKGRCSFNVGESSKASEQPEAEPKGKEDPVEELIKNKSALQILKIFKDRVNRRRNNDFKAYGIAYLCLTKVMTKNEPCNPDSLLHSLDLRSDLEKIKKRIKEMEKKERRDKKKHIATMEVTDEMKRGLKEVEEMIKRSDEERRKDSEKVKDLEKTFTDEGVSVETLREKLTSAFPGLGEIETKGHTADQDQGSLQTGVHYTDTVVKDMGDFEKELFAEYNNSKVDVSDFQGLKEAIKTAGGDIPDYLKHIASKIENTRGKPTEFAHKCIEILVCAAVKEMEEVPVDQLDPATLLKWRATLNMAKQFNFEVEFAEILLEKNLYAHFGFKSRMSLKRFENQRLSSMW